jgi:polysaccharide biosynthesis protein PslH
MKILTLMPYTPVPPNFGGALRIYNLLQQMCARHEVDILMFGSESSRKPVCDAFNLPSDRVHILAGSRWLSTQNWKRLGQAYSLLTGNSLTELAARNAPLQRMLDSLLSRNKYDLLQLEFPVMGYYRFESDAIKIMDAHNVEYEIHQRIAASADTRIRRFWADYECRKFQPEEIQICRDQDAILTTSQRDKDALDKDAPGVPKFVIPNGVDTTFFQTESDATEPESVVFTGAMDYFPNTDGIQYFLDRILPLVRKQMPNIKVYIVGNRPTPQLVRQASDNVVVTGFVDDIRPFVERSSAYIVPLRQGGGTRLKVLEAMSMRRPMVTTTVGCEGIDVTHNESVLMADEPESFAQAVVSLLGDEALQKKLVKNAFEIVRSHYDWDVIGVKLEDTYGKICEEARS